MTALPAELRLDFRSKFNLNLELGVKPLDISVG